MIAAKHGSGYAAFEDPATALLRVFQSFKILALVPIASKQTEQAKTDAIVGRWEAMPEGPGDEAWSRLWEYRLFAENMLYTRLGSFLTFETILLAVVATLFARPDLNRIVLKILAVVGLLITLIWLYVQHNVRQIFVVLESRALETFPEHRETIDRILRKRRTVNRLGIRAPALLLMTYVAPVLVTLVWIGLLIVL